MLKKYVKDLDLSDVIINENNKFTILFKEPLIEVDNKWENISIYKYKVGICISNNDEMLMYTFNPNAELKYNKNKEILYQDSGIILRNI